MRLAVSPCSNPELTLEEALSAYAEIGFHRFEMFTSWAKSAADISGDPGPVKRLLDEHGFSLSSIHIPPLDDPLDTSIERAAQTCRFAEALGCPIGIFKAKTRELFKAGARGFLDAIDGTSVTPVLQNHKGTAISTLEDYGEVLEAVGDPRLKCLLEVGHFHSVGVRWPEGYDALKGRIACVHIKDQVGPQSVPFGTGEIDLPGLFERLRYDGYEGDVVVEMEVADRENTLRYLKNAFEYVKEYAPWIFPE